MDAPAEVPGRLLEQGTFDETAGSGWLGTSIMHFCVRPGVVESSDRNGTKAGAVAGWMNHFFDYGRRHEQ